MSEVYGPASNRGAVSDGKGVSIEETGRGGRFETVNAEGLRVVGTNLVASLHISADRLRQAVSVLDKRRDEAVDPEARVAVDLAATATTVFDVELVVEATETDEGSLAPGLFMQACEGVERIAAALEEELAEARSFRRSLVSRSGEIDASQRRTDDAIGRLLG